MICKLQVPSYICLQIVIKIKDKYLTGMSEFPSFIELHGSYVDYT